MAPKKNSGHGSTSFATFLIVGPVCFFLGILFALFPYDYPLLWTSAPIPAEYYGQVETHLRFIYESPPLIARLLSITILVGFLGFFFKLFSPSQSNVLFDGASLILYLIGVGVYATNIVKGLRSVGHDIWSDEEWHERAATPEGAYMLGKEDSLRVMAASNTILALVLVGVLVLQAGQWYAESKEKEEFEKIEQDYQAKAAAVAADAAGASSAKTTGASTSSKKKA